MADASLSTTALLDQLKGLRASVLRALSPAAPSAYVNHKIMVVVDKTRQMASKQDLVAALPVIWNSRILSIKPYEKILIAK